MLKKMVFIGVSVFCVGWCTVSSSQPAISIITGPDNQKATIGLISQRYGDIVHTEIYLTYNNIKHYYIRYAHSIEGIEIIGDINNDGWGDFSVDGIKHISITNRKKKFDYMPATSYYWTGTPYFQEMQND